MLLSIFWSGVNPAETLSEVLVMATGKFITFEGGEGSGKSTQVTRLLEWLEDRGIDAIRTREPGGAPSGEVIRRLLVEGDTDRWQPVTEILLHYAARTEHLSRTVVPALEAGTWVVSDRFADSTFAYQGYGHGFDQDVINQIHTACVGDLSPDLTLILDISVETGLSRAQDRDQGEDRYERMGRDFHKRVRAGFLDIATKDSARCKVINAEQTVEDVFSDIQSVVNAQLGLSLS